MGDSRGLYRVLVGKTEESRRLERPTGSCQDFQKVGSGDIDWVDLARDRDRWRAIVNVVMNFQFP